MNIGKVFKHERERAGVTQKVMSEKLGITKSALWKIESGRNVPKPETVKRFCFVNGIPLAYLVIMSVEEEDFRVAVSSI